MGRFLYVCPPPRARIAPTAFGAVYCVETVGRAPKGSLYRRFLALADVVDMPEPPISAASGRRKNRGRAQQNHPRTHRSAVRTA